MPLVESGAADAFALGKAELAVACASHSGDAIHLEAVRSLLDKAGVDESLLACGAHWPLSEAAQREIARAGSTPRPIHNNCSGKHAGMLATAVQLGVRLQGYELPDHPVQIEIARVISEIWESGWKRSDGRRWLLGADLCRAARRARHGLCSARCPRGPRQAATRGDTPPRAGLLRQAGAGGGEGRFDTIAMRRLAPAVFCKGGAEGVHCAALPELGLGIALKIDDGAKRGAEAAMAHLFAALVPGADMALADFLDGELRNWKGQRAGGIQGERRARRGGRGACRVPSFGAKPHATLIRQYVGGTAQVAVWPGDSANVLVSGNKIELNSVSGDPVSISPPRSRVRTRLCAWA